MPQEHPKLRRLLDHPEMELSKIIVRTRLLEPYCIGRSCTGQPMKDRHKLGGAGNSVKRSLHYLQESSHSSTKLWDFVPKNEANRCTSCTALLVRPSSSRSMAMATVWLELGPGITMSWAPAGLSCQQDFLLGLAPAVGAQYDGRVFYQAESTREEVPQWPAAF
jgi:hypothetical protein